MTLVVGTAGHIDHGKTTLLRALTGIDADRLPEERRRGMTIDVGYAHATLVDAGVIDFVDVPGHDRLVGNMLVGAGEVDVAMLVIAADDGPRAQTLEHLELLDALGIDRGLAVVTKIDVAPPERVDAVVATTAELLAATSLAGAPVLPASAFTGQGLDAVRAALAGLAATGDAPVAGGPRLAVDRVFSVRGRGIVSTGTLRGGSVAAGDVLQVLPRGGQVRVREVQVHGHPVGEARGGRTAVNVSGPDAHGLRRGDVLAGGGVVDVSDRLLVALRAPVRWEAATSIPADRATLRLHLGTEQVEARVGRGGREAVALENGWATAILRLERPIGVVVGDRFVLRRPSPGSTAAGGVVLDAAPPRGVSRRRATPDRVARLAAAVDAAASVGARGGSGAASGVAGDAEAGVSAVGAARLDLHGALPSDGGVSLARDVEEAVAAVAIHTVGVHHRSDPVAPGLALSELRAAVARELRRAVTLDPGTADRAAAAVVDVLVGAGHLVRAGDRVRDPAHLRPVVSPATSPSAQRLLAALDVPAPPTLADAARRAGCSADVVRALEVTGEIVRVDGGIAWTAAQWRRLAYLALGLAGRAPLTPAALRDATGTSRKYVMALLEDLDRQAILTRTPAGHVPGPRAGSLDATAGVAPPAAPNPLPVEVPGPGTGHSASHAVRTTLGAPRAR